MKYIVLLIESQTKEYRREVPIIFPDLIVHKTMFEIVAREMIKNYKDPTNITVVSAGTINSPELMAGASKAKWNCYGRSTTLNVASRRQVDDELIRGYDYFHGLL